MKEKTKRTEEKKNNKQTNKRKKKENNFSAISWREQVNFQWDKDDVRFVTHNTLSWIFIVASSLKQQSVGKHVAPLVHIILILNQLIFALSP